MSAFFTFALVVVIIALILLAFSVAMLYYFNQFKSGVALTSNQLRTIRALNIISLILLLVVFIYGIFVAIQSRRVSDTIATAAAISSVTKTVTPVATPVAATPVAVATPVAATPVAATPVAVATPVINPMTPANLTPSRSLPPNLNYVGKTSEGIELFSVTSPTRVEAGQYICNVPQR